MIKKIIIILMVVATASAWGQNNRSGLPDHVEGTSEKMKAMDREVRTWFNKKKTNQEFLEMEQNILKQIEKHPEDRADGYLRLGQMHRLKYFSDVTNDSLAREYYMKAAEYLTRPCDKPFIESISYFLARCYMQPGEKQSLYTSQQYFIKCFENSPDLGSELGDFYLLGWAGTTDVYLATHLYMLDVINGTGVYSHNLEYAKRVLEHHKSMNRPHSTAALYEDYAYTVAIDNNSRNSIFPLTLAAEMGNIAAQNDLGLLYRTKLLGSSDKEYRTEGYRWLKSSADNGYIPGIYELGMLCLAYNMDPDLGDIYKHEAGNTFNESERKKVIEKVRQMMTTIAIKGYLPAMRILVEIYINMDEEPYITPNYEMGKYWYTVLENLGNIEQSNIMRKAKSILDNHASQFSNSEKDLYEKGAQNMALQVFYNNLDLLEKMDELKGFVHPYRRNHSDIKLGVPQELLDKANATSINNVTASDYLVAEAYNALYVQYERTLQKYAKDKKHLDGNRRRFYQALMEGLREHSAEKKYNLIKESEWEKWDGR